MVDEAGWCDRADGIGECGGVVCDKGFEIPWCWSRSTAAGVEVLGDHLLDESRVVVEFFAHLCFCVFACDTSGLAAFHDEFEALVEFIFDLFAIFEVLRWVVLKEFELFFAV